MREAIATDGAPKAIGPYSQAVRMGSLLFCSGQIPLDPSTGQLVTGDIAAQTRQVFANLGAVLQAPAPVSPTWPARRSISPT